MKIDRDIPIPKSSAESKIKYPLHEMEVGESFFSDMIAGLRGAAAYHAKRYGKRFASKLEGDGVRIWRVE